MTARKRLASSGRRVTPFDAKLGKRLRKCREEAGLSLEKVALQVGLSLHQISRYETGHSAIDTSILVRFARAVGVAPASLLDGLEP